MSDYLVPLLLILASVLVLRKKESSYDLLISGAGEGLQLVATILPTLIILMTAVTMLRSS